MITDPRIFVPGSDAQYHSRCDTAHPPFSQRDTVVTSLHPLLTVGSEFFPLKQLPSG